MSDYKITQAEIDAVNVQSIVGDTLPGNTIAEKKENFDKLPELICTKFNAHVDYVDASFISSDELGDITELTTDVKSDTVSAINEVDLLSKYHTATAETNGDFKVSFPSTFTLASGDIVKISFPSATDNTQDARLSIDDGTTHINIYTSMNVPASSIESRVLSFVYNGTKFVPLDTISGENSNGNWVQYPDGTQECYIDNYTFSGDCDNATGVLYRTDYEDVTLPLAFVDASIVGTIGIGSFARFGNIYEVSSTTVRVVQFAGLSASSFGARIRVIGRWK